MKKLILFFATLIFFFQLKAQVEVSVNPFAMPFEFGAFGVDYNINDNFGIGADFGIGQGFGAFYVSGKFYFGPQKGADRFLVGTFLGTIKSIDSTVGISGIGIMFGYKWVSKRRITFELSVGQGIGFNDSGFEISIGRFTSINSIPYLRLNVGYRFKQKTERKR